jgi:hypothetical protein
LFLPSISIVYSNWQLVSALRFDSSIERLPERQIEVKELNCDKSKQAV